MDIPISDITIGKRKRKDMGDIPGLAESIESEGQLQSIAVAEDLSLIAGARRIAAFKRLKRKTIRADILPDINTAIEFLRAEDAENTCRKDYTLSEKKELADRLEVLVKREAAKRKAEGQKKGGKAGGRGRSRDSFEPNKLKAKRQSQTRDIVAHAVGMGHAKLEKVRAIVNAAEAEPETYGDLAEQIDQTGTVHTAWKEMKHRRDGNGKTSNRPAPRGTASIRYDSPGVKKICELADKAAAIVKDPSTVWSTLEVKNTVRELHATINKYLKPT